MVKSLSSLSVIFLIALIISGCSSSKVKIRLSECDESIQLTGEKVPVPDSVMMGGFIVRCVNDTSALIRYFGRPFILAYLSFNDLSVHPFVNIGRGAGEMLGSADISYTGVSSDGHRMAGLFDINLKKFFMLDVDSSISSNSASIVYEKSIPNNTWSLFPTESGFIHKTSMGEYGISFMKESHDGEISLIRSLWPREASLQYYNFLQSIDCMRPEGDKVAICMVNIDKIYILDVNDGSLQGTVTDHKWLKRDDIEEASRQKSEGSENHYMYSCCDSDYIYALYSPGDELRIFDWDGNFVHRFHLDHALISISISPDKHLFGTDMQEGLSRYDLSSVH